MRQGNTKRTAITRTATVIRLMLGTLAIAALSAVALAGPAAAERATPAAAEFRRVAIDGNGSPVMFTAMPAVGLIQQWRTNPRSLSPGRVMAAKAAEYLIGTGASPAVTTCFNVVAIWSGANGLAVAAEFGGSTLDGTYGMLRARSSVPGLWESWYVCRDAATRRTILMSNAIGMPYFGRAVSAELSYTGSNYAMLRARASTTGPWEEFLTSSAPCGVCGTTIISKADNRFVSTEIDYSGSSKGMLRARATSAGAWEQFYW
jgi:hypothetical protein